MKQAYEIPEIEIIELWNNAEDVIRTSGTDPDPYDSDIF